MTVDKIKQKLIEYGLNERCVAIYLSLLQQKDQTVFVLAKQVNLPRTTVYQDLEYLKSIDLVGVIKKNRVAHWYAEHPRRLLKDAESKMNKVQEIFPELESLMNANNTLQPEVRFYTGKESIKEIIHMFYDVLATRDIRRLYTFSHPRLQEFFPKFLPEVLKRKNELGIFTYLIAPQTAKNQDLESYKNDKYREVRYISEQYPFTSTMIICDEYIALFSLKDEEVYAMTIASPAFSAMFKAMFMNIWNSIGLND